MVLAAGAEPIEDLQHGRPRIRLKPARAAIGADQRVGFLRTGRQDTAWAMVLERAADQMDAVGEQSRGERIALETIVGDAVEGEANLLAGFDPAPAGDAIAGHDRASLSSASVGRGCPAL